MYFKILQIIFLTVSLLIPELCLSQNKLSQDQIVNAVKIHQQNADSAQVAVEPLVLCDSTTTKIVLEVFNDSVVNEHTYSLSFTKNEIEVDVYDVDNHLYRSTFEYENTSFEKLKTIINQHNLRKVDLYNDSVLTKENDILRLYVDDMSYMSVECYNGRTNVSGAFHDLVKEMKTFVTEFSSITTVLEEYEMCSGTCEPDTIKGILTISEDLIKFKSKGGEFKKIKITCDTEDWEVIECPEWVTYSRNKNNEIIFESTKNETNKKREGVVRIGILGETKVVQIVQM